MQKPLRFFWFWLALAHASCAQAQLIRISDCAGSGLAKRNGSPTCWVKLDQFCIPQAVWKNWLANPESGALCGDWVGRWQLFSPYLNEPPGPTRASSVKQTVRTFKVEKLPEGKPGRFGYLRKQLEAIRERLDEWLTPLDDTGILRLLLVGTHPADGSSELLMLLGFVHLFWVSGIHLYALARLWDWGMKRLACSVSAFELPLAAVQAGSRLGTAMIWLTAWGLAGARLGMLRPWALLFLRGRARKLGLKWKGLAPFFLALGLDALVGAWRGNLSDPGRWIYALACGGAVLSRTSPGMAVGSWVLAAIFQAVRGGTVALATPFLSLLCVPIFAGAVYPLLLTACVFKTFDFAPIADALASCCNLIAGSSVRLLSQRLMNQPSLWCVGPFALLGGAVLGAMALFARRRFRVAALAFIGAARLGLSAAFASHVQPVTFRVEQLDVGQGDAALVESEGGAGGSFGPSASESFGLNSSESFGMIDSGSERSLSDRDWIELLARRGVQRLDWIALTHLDEDHSGGVKRLGKLVPIGCVATARAEIQSPRGQIYKQELEQLGIRLTDWSGPCVPFPTLAPSEHGSHKANQNMGAIFIPLGPHGSEGFYLSAGDADARDEPRMGAWAANQALELAVGPKRVLKISHHGSKTSSNPEFLKQVHPTEAWISVGAGNRYGHPSASVLERIGGLHIPLKRTDEQGALCAGQCAD